jgi:hypothetical protein
MGPSFDLAALIQRVERILSGILNTGFPVPGVPGLEIPLWYFLVAAVVVFLLILNPFRKDRP